MKSINPSQDFLGAITHICSCFCPCQFAAAPFELYVQPCMLQRPKATELPKTCLWCPQIANVDGMLNVTKLLSSFLCVV